MWLCLDSKVLSSSRKVLYKGRFIVHEIVSAWSSLGAVRSAQVMDVEASMVALREHANKQARLCTDKTETTRKKNSNEKIFNNSIERWRDRARKAHLVHLNPP
jgi:hypothetical protein